MHEKPMEISGSEEDLRSLHDWLRDEDELRRAAVEWRSMPPKPDEMGSAGVLTVTLADDADHAVLARSIAVWTRHRAAVALTITAGGRVAEVDSRPLSDPAELAEIIAKLVR
ncbi:hypothetical protein [Nocardia sp. NRRL S-836]|uniref:effector-associated constant component EACC1 n=1 Tax=Nocardia sp. NRRL S-836 TaxID=1519492 RepID=UPI0006AE8EAA|nr:hypothetical protein [Nocardia sp. NRRL S-836]KOV85025.1 hypothetical protein ADL03_11865 [Nocardia sp. NRRL S-836]